jgi:hypothetical protein
MLELFFAYLAGFLTLPACVTILIGVMLIRERIREGR